MKSPGVFACRKGCVEQGKGGKHANQGGERNVQFRPRHTDNVHSGRQRSGNLLRESGAALGGGWGKREKALGIPSGEKYSNRLAGGIWNQGAGSRCDS